MPYVESTDRLPKSQLIDELLQHLETLKEDMEAGHGQSGFGLLQPVASDAGIFYDPAGYVYLFDLVNDHDTDWEPDKYKIDDEDALPLVMETLREQILNASTGQLVHYVRWAFNAAMRS